MRFAGLAIKAIAATLLLVGLFGGFLDAATMLNLSVSRWLAVAAAFGLLALDRELQVLRLKWQLDASKDLQSRIDKLAEFRNEVINSLYAGTPSKGEFETWVSRFHRWEDSLVAYLEKNFPYAVFEMFMDQGMIPSADFDHTSKNLFIRRRHRSYLRRIAKHIEILESLIQQNTKLTKDREPGLREVLGSTNTSQTVS